MRVARAAYRALSIIVPPVYATGDRLALVVIRVVDLPAVDRHRAIGVPLQVHGSELLGRAFAVGLVVDAERLVLRGTARPLRDVAGEVTVLEGVHLLLGLLALLFLLLSELLRAGGPAVVLLLVVLTRLLVRAHLGGPPWNSLVHPRPHGLERARGAEVGRTPSGAAPVSPSFPTSPRGRRFDQADRRADDPRASRRRRPVRAPPASARVPARPRAPVPLARARPAPQSPEQPRAPPGSRRRAIRPRTAGGRSWDGPARDRAPTSAASGSRAPSRRPEPSHRAALPSCLATRWSPPALRGPRERP